jgi:hypothetical protein
MSVITTEAELLEYVGVLADEVAKEREVNRVLSARVDELLQFFNMRRGVASSRINDYTPRAGGAALGARRVRFGGEGTNRDRVEARACSYKSYVVSGATRTGTKAYRVCLEKSGRLRVYKTLDNGLTYNDLIGDYKEIKKILVGRDTGDYEDDASVQSVLVLLESHRDGEHRYLFVGNRVYEFRTHEAISELYTFVGDDGESITPFALGKKYVYVFDSELQPAKVNRKHFKSLSARKNFHWKTDTITYYEDEITPEQIQLIDVIVEA